MEYTQLERCYKTVLLQRDKYHVALVDAEQKIDDKDDQIKELKEKLQFLVDNDSINDSSIDKEVEQLLLK